MSKVTSEQVLSWAKQIEAQRTQKAILYSLRNNNEVDMVSNTKHLTEPDKYIAKHTITPEEENLVILVLCDVTSTKAMPSIMGRHAIIVAS